MKRILVILAALAAPLYAAASPGLAGDWGIKASGLYEETAELIAELDTDAQASIPQSYEIEIERFAVAASQLGSWVDGNDGPSDLGCIFRGMAEEGSVQLEALEQAETPSQTRASLVRLATMFSDAEVIAIAAIHADDHETPAVSSNRMSCPVNADMARAALD